MFETVRKVTSVVVKGTQAASHATVDFVSENIDKIDITPLLDILDEKLQPETITAVCRPTGPQPDDYHVEVDMKEFSTALEANKYVRPVLRIKAATDTMDRTQLTDALIKGFEGPLSEMATNRWTQEVRDATEVEGRLTDSTLRVIGEVSGFFNWGALAAGVLVFFGAAAAIGPILLLLLAAGGIKIVIELPRLFVRVIRFALAKAPDATKEAQTSAINRELEQYRPLLRTLITRMDIEIDDGLVAEWRQYT